MKHTSEIPLFQERLDHLERCFHKLRIAFIFCLLVALGAVCYALCAHSVRADNSAQIIRARGLIIEDTHGRPRILFGAPVPKVSGRKRQDDATGMVILAENGADRVAIGAPAPSPQLKGKVAQRIASEAGLVIDDAEGNERGGMGILENGNCVACLDYPASVSREAICMAVLPEQGFAGFTVNAETGSESERAEMAVLKDGTALLKLADTDGNERTMFLVQGVSPAQFLVIDPKTRTKEDVLVKLKP